MRLSAKFSLVCEALLGSLFLTAFFRDVLKLDAQGHFNLFMGLGMFSLLIVTISSEIVEAIRKIKP